MATQITVAVGANGEVLSALQMREGARADRLDSEATAKQAKQAAVDKLDDGTNGRENKLGKYDPSRDPAAFARKKKPELAHGFHGLNIVMQHTAVNDLTPWGSMEGMNYMKFIVQGIGSNGGMSARTADIDLVRNFWHPMFRSDFPDGLQPLPEVGSNNNGGLLPYPALYYQDDNVGQYAVPGTKFATEPLTFYTNVYPREDFFAENSFYPFGFGRFLQYEFRYSDTIGPIEGSTALTIYEKEQAGRNEDSNSGHPVPEANLNTFVNGRRGQGDEFITGRQNEESDPVYELFMLPYTKEKCFLLIVYTDYNIQARSHWTITGSCSTVLYETKDRYEYDYIFEAYVPTYTETGNAVDYSRSPSVHYFPDGYYWPTFDWNSHSYIGGSPSAWPVITEEGSKVIQQIILYEIEDGELTQVPDEDIPQELRDNVNDNLQVNFKEFKLNESGLSDSSFFATRSGYEVIVIEGGGRALRKLDLQDTSFEVPNPTFNLGGNQFAKNKAIAGRAYIDSNTRDRSASKGYGFGKVSTYDHFENAYIDSNLNGFADDYYFTPAVYSYLLGSAVPSISYERASIGARLVDPDGGLFNLRQAVDYDGGARVRFIEGIPKWINQPWTGRVGEWQSAPQLGNSTHRCWNWGRPDICWEYLNRLGFGPNLIGERPPTPNEQEENPNE